MPGLRHCNGGSLQRSCFAIRFTHLLSFLRFSQHVQNNRCLGEFGRCHALGGGGGMFTIVGMSHDVCDLATRGNLPFLSTWNEHKKMPVGSAENFKSSLSSVSVVGQAGGQVAGSQQWERFPDTRTFQFLRSDCKSVARAPLSGDRTTGVRHPPTADFSCHGV
jgi:hypothetical protein